MSGYLYEFTQDAVKLFRQVIRHADRCKHCWTDVCKVTFFLRQTLFKKVGLIIRGSTFILCLCSCNISGIYVVVVALKT